MRVVRYTRAQVNKVKHLSRVNGNINTPRRLRLETSRANERGTKDFDATGAAEGSKRVRSVEGDSGESEGGFLSAEKAKSRRFKVVKVDFNFEAVLKVARANESSRFWSCAYEAIRLRIVVAETHTICKTNIDI